jgi:hypothetical protein
LLPHASRHHLGLHRWENELEKSQDFLSAATDLFPQAGPLHYEVLVY